MTTAEKLAHHFQDRSILWVPMWGISKLRKRCGGFAGAIEGKSTWYDEWYTRAMSPEAAEKLAGLGVNLVILPFSLGGSAEMEREERDDFERMAGHLHRHGITVLPYLQWQNILQESGALPDAEWAVNLDGSRRQYAAWRRTVCQSSKGFSEYMKGLVRDAVKRGADGLWIDNTYLAPCRCPQCERNFRQYLSDQRGDLLDLLRLRDFSCVEPPPALGERILDPIQQAYIEFNCARCEGVLREVKEVLETLAPQALFATNPGLYRGRNTHLMGVDLYAQGRLNDILYLENKACPEVVEGRMRGNFPGFITLSEVGCAAVAGSWKNNADYDSTRAASSSGLPDTAAEVERLIFEGAAYQQVSGMFWAVRARNHGICERAEDLMQMYFEKPDVADWMRSATSAVTALPRSERLANAARIGLYHAKASLSFAFPTAGPALAAAAELLLRHRLPYRPVFSQALSGIADCDLVVLPETVFLSDREAEALTAFVRDGGRLLAIGNCGLHDEYGFLRPDYVLKEVCGASYFDRASEVVLTPCGEGFGAFVPGEAASATSGAAPDGPAWLDREPAIIATIDKLLPRGRMVTLQAQGLIGLSVAVDPDRRLHVSLMRYDACAEDQTISLKIRPPAGTDPVRAVEALWHNCRGETERPTATVSDGGDWTFEIRRFRRFGRMGVGARSEERGAKS